MLAIRGKRSRMIFQDPMTSFNPVATVEKQIAEVLMPHGELRGRGQAFAPAHEPLSWSACPTPGGGSTPIRTSLRRHASAS